MIQDEKLLSLEQVLAMVGVSKATIYNWIDAGEFPRPVQCGPRLVRWRKSEVDGWQLALPRAG